MNDQDYIKAAIELADEWKFSKCPNPTIRTPDRAYYYLFGEDYAQECLDALAAQLVRQVDALEDYVLQSHWDEVRVVEPGLALIAAAHKDDRTMNTLKCIVDSGVLT